MGQAGDGAAEAGYQRRHRHDDGCGNRDQQQRSEQPVGLAAGDEAPPRGGEAELRLEENRAERKAAQQQAGGGRLPVEKHEGNEDCGRQVRRGEERPVEPRPVARAVGSAVVAVIDA